MKTRIIIVAVAVLIAGCVSTESSRQQDSKANPANPNAAETKQSIQTITSQRLASIRQVSVKVQPEGQTCSGLDMKNVQKTVEHRLLVMGYSVSDESIAEATFVLSCRQERVFGGTSDSFWHPMLLTWISLALELSNSGRLLTQEYAIDSMMDTTTTFKFSDIRVVPIDVLRPTYIDPVGGGAWGAGVQFTSGGGAGAIASTKALQDYKWDQLVNPDAILSDLDRQLQEKSPMKISDSTKWAK